MNGHSCSAVVLSCIDYRIQKNLRQWLDNKFKDELYDYVGQAGCTKNLDSIIKQIDISVKLHNVKEVDIIHHEDCGAYGERSSPKKHSLDMKKAKSKILSKYPNLKVNTYYLKLNGEMLTSSPGHLK